MKSKAGSFDAFRLARERGVLEGTLDAVASERLLDRVAEGGTGEGRVRWRISGTSDTAGRPALAIAVAGEVPVTCQRCLSEFAFQVDRETIAVLARDEQEADVLDASTDDEVLVASHPLDAAGLVEDELLLTLPFAPTHEPGACEAGKE